MARSKSSNTWLREHFSDQYVKDSQKDGYRSRASYKLVELDGKDRLFKQGMTVVDLGSAPGGWSQVAAKRVGEKGRVFASDILAMDSIADVDFVQGDFTDEIVLTELLRLMDGRRADLVMSDMAPNLSGIADVDQPQSIYLVELALDMAQQVLSPGGTFVAKVFQGEGFDPLFASVKASFDKVVIRKPDASRARSREIYLVGKGFKGA